MAGFRVTSPLVSRVLDYLSTKMQKLAAIAMAVALVALPASTAASSAAPLTLLSAADAGDGVCLDGSPPGYYHWPANTTADPEAATKYVLYFKGGGWCYDEDSCASRSMGPLGSAAHFPKEFGFGAGPSSASAELNPTFVNWNRIILWCESPGAPWMHRQRSVRLTHSAALQTAMARRGRARGRER